MLFISQWRLIIWQPRLETVIQLDNRKGNCGIITGRNTFVMTGCLTLAHCYYLSPALPVCSWCCTCMHIGKCRLYPSLQYHMELVHCPEDSLCLPIYPCLLSTLTAIEHCMVLLVVAFPHILSHIWDQMQKADLLTAVFHSLACNYKHWSP